MGAALLLYIVFHYVLTPIDVIFPPLLVALVLVYLLNPIVSFLERKGLRRGWATLITYVVFLSAVGVGLSYLIPVIANQVDGFTETVPDLLERAKTGIVALADDIGFDINEENLLQTFNPGEGGGARFIGQVLSIGASVLHVVLIVVLGPVIAFYLLVDLPKLRQGFQAVVPIRRRPEVASVLEKLGAAIGGYFRGQLLVALFVGMASMIGLYVVGLPYWAPVGLICGLFNLVPLIGPFIGGIPAMFIAFTAPEAGSGFLIHPRPGWPLALSAAAALLLVQQIDNHIISPNVVARTVRLHPLTVMLSLLAAGTVMGLWGMLLVIPVVAAVKILLMHYWDTRAMWPPPQEALDEATAERDAISGEAGVKHDRDDSASEPAGPPTPSAPLPVEQGTEGSTGGWWFRRRFGGRGDGGRTPETTPPAAPEGSSGSRPETPARAGE